MSGSSPPENSGFQCYSNDIDYLTAEFEWMRVRAHRIEVQRELEQSNEGISKRYSWRGRDIQTPINADIVACLTEQEAVLRRNLDARREINRGAGPALGLDRLCDEFRLNNTERHILLLATLLCFGSNKAIQTISGVDPTMNGGSIYLEIVSLFLELSPGEHLQMMQSILPTAPLRSSGLVHLTYDPSTPSDLLAVGIDLTGESLARIANLPSFRKLADPNVKGID